MAELVDARDLKSLDFGRTSSILVPGIIQFGMSSCLDVVQRRVDHSIVRALAEHQIDRVHMDVYGIDSSDFRCGYHPAAKRDMRSVRPSLKTQPPCSQFSVKLLLKTGKRSGMLKSSPPCVPFLPAEEPDGIDCQVERLEMHSLHGLDGKTLLPIVAFAKELQCQMKVVTGDERTAECPVMKTVTYARQPVDGSFIEEYCNEKTHVEMIARLFIQCTSQLHAAAPGTWIPHTPTHKCVFDSCSSCIFPIPHHEDSIFNIYIQLIFQIQEEQWK